MNEYLEKEAVLKAVDERAKHLVGDKTVSVDAIRRFIENRPAVDVRPVIYAHWVYDRNAVDWDIGGWVCSMCHTRNDNLPLDERISPYSYAGSNFCPNCGAKMRRENENA